MLDMERRLEQYAEFLDEAVAPIEVREVVEQRVVVGADAPVAASRSVLARLVVARPWAVAATAVVVALLVVGGIQVMFSAGGGDDPVSDPPPRVLEEETPAGDPGIPAFRGVMRVEIPKSRISELAAESEDHSGYLEEELGLRLTAATLADIELLYDVDYRPGPFGGMRVQLSEQSRGVNLIGPVPDFAVFDGDRVGVYRSNANVFSIEGRESFESALGALLWSRWEGICRGTETDLPVEEPIGGQAVDYTLCERLRGDLEVWVDRETGLVLRVEPAGVRTALTGWDVLQRIVPDGSFSFIKIIFDPPFAGDEFTLAGPTGASVEVQPEPPDGTDVPHPDVLRMVGDAAPELTGDLLGGGRFDLAEQRGRRVAVLLWATWCPPCLDMLEAFQRYADEHDPGFDLVTVAFVDDVDSARAMVERGKITLPVIDGSDWDGEEWSRRGIFAFPAVVFVDEAGTVVHVHIGMDPLDDLFESVGWAN